MNFDPETTSTLGQLAAGVGAAYPLSAILGATYEIGRQNFTDVDVDQNLEIYQKLMEGELEAQKASDIALAFFNLGRKGVLEKELGIEPEYGQKAKPRRSQSRALGYFDELPYDLD